MPPQCHADPTAALSREKFGEGEIRTHEAREGPAVFKTAAFNRSATSPRIRKPPFYSGFPNVARDGARPNRAICSHLVTSRRETYAGATVFARSFMAARPTPSTERA